MSTSREQDPSSEVEDFPKKVRIVFSTILKRKIMLCDPVNQQHCPKFNFRKFLQDETDGKSRKQTEFKPKYAQKEPQYAIFFVV